MTQILCSVQECSHNREGECFSNFVSVKGTTASQVCDTCCSSFLSKSTYSDLTNNTIESGACNSLECQVETCKYNCAYSCHLDSISMNGKSPSTYNDTNCASFEKK